MQKREWLMQLAVCYCSFLILCLSTRLLYLCAAWDESTAVF